MATRKTKPKAKKKPAQRKKVAPAKRTPAPKKKAKAVAAKKKKRPAFDPDATQQIAVAEIIGDIEERQALDRLGK